MKSSNKRYRCCLGSNINSISDLDNAAVTLEQTDPSTSNNSDLNQLEAELNNF